MDVFSGRRACHRHRACCVLKKVHVQRRTYSVLQQTASPLRRGLKQQMGCGASKARAAQTLDDKRPQPATPRTNLGQPTDQEPSQTSLIPSPPSQQQPLLESKQRPLAPTSPGTATQAGLKSATHAQPEEYGYLPPPTEPMPANSQSYQQALPASAIEPDGPVVLILGPPGSGKDTVCERLAGQSGCVHLSATELMRAAITSSSQHGIMISNMIRAGQIVPAQVTLDLLKSAIEESRSGGPYVIQGFPKTLDSLEAFDSQLQGAHAGCAAAVHLELGEDALTARLLERGKTSKRTDDTAEAIARRLSTYRQQELPVVDRLLARGVVTSVDASQSEDAVAGAVRAVVDSVHARP